jgi:hypothetical protein
MSMLVALTVLAARTMRVPMLLWLSMVLNVIVSMPYSVPGGIVYLSLLMPLPVSMHPVHVEPPWNAFIEQYVHYCIYCSLLV